jgi:hypothetical protein
VVGNENPRWIPVDLAARKVSPRFRLFWRKDELLT